MGTTLSDIIVPELFNPYVIQKTLEKSALVQSGIVQNDAEFDKLASQASPLVNMPLTIPFLFLLHNFLFRCVPVKSIVLYSLQHLKKEYKKSTVS